MITLPGERIGNVEHWKEEVKTELDAMIQENQALQECLEMLEKVAADLIQPLRVAQECLYSREKRRGIDLVHDNVERELIRVRLMMTTTLLLMIMMMTMTMTMTMTMMMMMEIIMAPLTHGYIKTIIIV